MSKRLHAELVCQALKAAYWRRKPAPRLIMHSDRGSQYASDAYRKLISDFRMLQFRPTTRRHEALRRLGYRHVALRKFDLVYPFFQRPAVWPTTHHVHLCVVGSEQEDRHLAFRDHLRNNPTVAREYVDLKQKLAVENHGATLESRQKYSLSKTQFVLSVLERARSNLS